MKNAIYLLLLGIIGIFIFILYDLNGTVDKLCKDMVQKSLLQTDLELDNFFVPVEEDILITAQEHRVMEFDNDDYLKINAEFRPLLKNKKQLSSIMIATTEGDEFLLLELDTAWMIRTTNKGCADSLPFERYWHDGVFGEPHYTRFKDTIYDPRTRPWFKSAMEHPEMDISWTDPYTFFTTRDAGVTISTRWRDTVNNRDMVVAFDVLLNDISSFTTQMNISQNGLVFVLTEDERIIGLPAHSGYDSPADIQKDVLKPYKEINHPQITTTLDIWNDLPDKDSIFNFTSEGEKWWGSVQEFMISPDDRLYVGVVVPEEDFVSAVKHSEKIIILGFVFVLIFTVYILKAYRDQSKTAKLLQEQKSEIEEKKEVITLAKHALEEKNEEILDSINYAKRIQSAILPPDSYWKKQLPNSFVLYKPKDIVAGDFYWMEIVQARTMWSATEASGNNDNIILFAAADCTGHGVPGAMVSVVCHNSLNRAVREFGLSEPGQILDKVTDLVIRTFERSDHEVKDGMDISLCAYHPEQKKLEFAAAHNPLWILREGKEDYPGLKKSDETETHALYEVKANKQPIGKFSHRKDFVNHTIQLQEGDTIYMSSDGYPDQFGGKKGKKLKSKAFKKLLFELVQMSPEDQQKKLDKWFEDWRGDFEQLDDVCVIGVRI